MVLLRWFWLREIGFSAQTTAMANCDGFLEEANSISFDNISRFAIIYVITLSLFPGSFFFKTEIFFPAQLFKLLTTTSLSFGRSTTYSQLSSASQSSEAGNSTIGCFRRTTTRTGSGDPSLRRTTNSTGVWIHQAWANYIVQVQVIPALGEQLIVHNPRRKLMDKSSKTDCS